MISLRKLGRYGFMSRSLDMAKTILQWTVKGTRRIERQKVMGRQYRRMDWDEGWRCRKGVESGIVLFCVPNISTFWKGTYSPSFILLSYVIGIVATL